MGKLDTAPLLEPAGLAAWRAWLRRRHASSTGVWLVLDKKSAPRVRLSLSEAVEEALCWGWIDSQVRALDATRFRIWLAPRKPRSVWSPTNKERVAGLAAEGRMQPAGRAAIEAAQANGSWSQIDGVDAFEVPKDLAAALRRLPGARAHFDAFPKSVRRGLLGWIALARTAATRARRVEESARMAAQNRRAQFEAAGRGAGRAKKK